MEIKAADVAKLRQMTGAGMMDCKKALVEANGDYERAKEIIREKGKLVAAKRADRETSEGAVIAKVNGEKAIVIGLGCETDFVAKNAEFQAAQDHRQARCCCWFQQGIRRADCKGCCNAGSFNESGSCFS